MWPRLPTVFDVFVAEQQVQPIVSPHKCTQVCPERIRQWGRSDLSSVSGRRREIVPIKREVGAFVIQRVNW
jgi:hypothetical protein